MGERIKDAGHSIEDKAKDLVRKGEVSHLRYYRVMILARHASAFDAIAD